MTATHLKLSRADWLRPRSIKQADELLAELFPEWAFSERVLRGFCEQGKVRCLCEPSHGVSRSRRFRVRLHDLKAAFESWEQ